jgi:transcriptional regulator with XRE-family HTH domain
MYCQIMTLDASDVLTKMRSARQLSMNALADLSGVPVSTVSRIESRKVEPTWSMMNRLANAAGFRLDPHLSEAGSDEPFIALLRQFNQGDLEEQARLLRRFPSTARLALVAKRAGSRRVELDMELGDALATLERQGQKPVLSSLEAFAEDTSRTRSFSPVVYVEQPDLVIDFNPATRTSPLVMFLLPTTDNIRAVTHDGAGTRMVNRQWALLDSLASPGRQADATAHLLDSLVTSAA